MKWIALILWVLPAGGGFVMLAIWLARGGMRQQGEAGSRIRPPLILSHFLLAAGGLVVWIVYVFADKDALAWIALVVLGVVALLGFTMFFIWAGQRQTRQVVDEAGSPRSPATAGPGPEPAEQHFPAAIVTLHGLLAVATVPLVLLTALG